MTFRNALRRKSNGTKEKCNEIRPTFSKDTINHFNNIF